MIGSMKKLMIFAFLVSLLYCYSPQPKSQPQPEEDGWASSYDDLNDYTLFIKKSSIWNEYPVFPYVEKARKIVNLGILIQGEFPNSHYLNSVRIYNKEMNEIKFNFKWNEVQRTIDLRKAPNIYIEKTQINLTEPNRLKLRKILESDTVGIQFIGDYNSSAYRFPPNLVELFRESFEAFDKVKIGKHP